MSESKKILIVDDDPNLREDLKDVLEMCDYEVSSAENGEEGLKAVEINNPDLIISDIAMPVMDGYEFLSELQKNVQHASIPFLFVTAKGQYSELRKGMSLGADDYIFKPYDLNDLLRTIETRLGKVENNTKDLTMRFESVINNIRKSIPHEIRTPITGIMNQAERLLRKNPDNELISDSVLEILSDAKRLNRLFENYIFLTNLELIKEEELNEIKSKKTYLPNSIINHICKYKFENKNRNFDIKLFEDLDELPIHETHFTKMIYELVDNSIKFSEEDSTITVNSMITPDNFKFSISNYGRTLTDEEIKQIGEYVQFNRDTYEQKGLGLGLSIVKKVLNLYDGDLIINNNNNRTTISFQIQSK